MMQQQRVERVVKGDVACKLEDNAISYDDVAGAARVALSAPPAQPMQDVKNRSSSSSCKHAQSAKAGAKASQDGKLVFQYDEGRELLPAFNFGKHSGKTVLDVAKESPTYLTWMLKENFADDVKAIVMDALQQAGHRVEKYATLDGKLVYEYAEGFGRLPTFNFGRHKGEFVVDVAIESPTYLKWMLKNDFADDVLDIVTEALLLVADNPAAAPGRLTHTNDTVKPGDRATCDGTLVWEPTLTVGKYSGKTLKYVAAKSRSYLKWMLTDNAGFPEDVKRLVKETLLD